MVKIQNNKKSFYIDYDILMAITALHKKKLRKLNNSFMKYRTVIHYYFKENNSTYSCPVVSKLASKLWKNESENIKNMYKRMVDETKRKEIKAKKNCDINSKETRTSLRDQVQNNNTADFKISFKQQKLAPSYTNAYPLTNVDLKKPYNNLLFDNYNRIQKLERELSDTLEIVEIINKLLFTV
ncbi:hypothetical protein F8M41_026031 [Gigaspora margarita]|uniref:HMG box domain-containing protein n=1 Tax=Gigaspora margarita TaxID=4874 RepID=A0A8H4AAK9_GIGMA|nr:hypothetical protein F8M41_026031 [Gigaspora margarita]